MKSGIKSIKNKHIFMVGIKGSGMASLAHYYSAHGAHVSGSDTSEPFYTEKILKSIGISQIADFNSALPPQCSLVVYSAAYNQNENPQLIAATQQGIPMYSYPEAIGKISKQHYSVGISGMHGKTTITGMCAAIIKECLLQGAVLIGGAVASLKNMSALIQGNNFFVAETCEYRRHFCNYHPSMVLVSSIDLDHTDYFADIEDIKNAFFQYILQLPKNGLLVYCADDPVVREVVEMALLNRDIDSIPYGHTAIGDYNITHVEHGVGATYFQIAKWGRRRLRLKIPGDHSILNAVAAIAVCEHLPGARKNSKDMYFKIRRALSNYRGAVRRCQVVGSRNGITVIDDYAHHPTAIQKTLAGLRKFYAANRIIVDFMPHTYSRTHALLNEFATSFQDADIVYLNDIYSSAREHHKKSSLIIDLKKGLQKHHQDIRYYPNFRDAQADCINTLAQGDLFVTLGAGNNWQLGKSILKELKQRNHD